MPDGSAVEYMPQEAGTITGVLWRTKNQTPDIEFDYRKMKIKLDARGTAKLSGTLTFGDLEKLPRHSYVTLLQCGAPTPHGIVKWTGVRFSDFAQAMGAQSFAYYGRLVGSDGYFIDEDMKTLMHPQVILAWLLNDEPIPPQHGAPLRLIVPFRYGARSLKAITEISFTATSFARVRARHLYFSRTRCSAKLLRALTPVFAGYAERCAVDPGSFQTPECGTVPGLQRTTKKCCAAPGTSRYG